MRWQMCDGESRGQHIPAWGQTHKYISIITFYWNTAILISLRTICGYFSTKLEESTGCYRDHVVVHKHKIFHILFFTEKVYCPCCWLLQRMVCSD
jgi:hypothetical protein